MKCMPKPEKILLYILNSMPNTDKNGLVIGWRNFTLSKRKSFKKPTFKRNDTLVSQKSIPDKIDAEKNNVFESKLNILKNTLFNDIEKYKNNDGNFEIPTKELIDDLEYNLIITKDASVDLNQLDINIQGQCADKVFRLVAGEEGFSNFETLTGNLKGLYSCRLTQKDRIVFNKDKANKTISISSFMNHYDD